MNGSEKVISHGVRLVRDFLNKVQEPFGNDADLLKVPVEFRPVLAALLVTLRPTDRARSERSDGFYVCSTDNTRLHCYTACDELMRVRIL